MPSPPIYRTRRINDALTQLVGSLVPPLSTSSLPHCSDDDDASDTYSDELARTELAETDEQRHRHALELAWRILDKQGEDYHPAAPISAPLGGRGGGIGGGGGGGGGGSSSVSAEIINNAPDLIKRKLLRENASPDKAVRFSNLYSRLLTQPVLGQKWAILYLLYRVAENSGTNEGRRTTMTTTTGITAGVESPRRSVVTMGGDVEVESGNGGGAPGRREGARSPLLETQQLESMLLKDGFHERKTDSIAPGSSASAVGGFPDWESPAGLNGSSSQRRATYLRMPRTKEGRQKVEEKKRDGKATSRRGVHSVAGGESELVAQGQKQEQWQEALDTGSVMKPAESTLLRDLPFNLQGLSSTNLEFLSSSILRLPSSLPVPIISILHTLAEPCLLYRGLSGFVNQSDGGLVEQSLRAAIGNELRSYLGLVATLEGEIRTALTEESGDAGNPKCRVKIGVTLKRCVIWMREATMALRLMSLMVAEVPNKKGGQLISMIHEFSSSHGDPFVGTFAERLLAHVTRPFYGMLTQWIYDGELSDPYHEFFVVEPDSRPSADPRRIATSVWDDKYKLDDDMVPTIMTQDFAKKVFLIGKSLNFIRYGCGDSAWVVAYSKDASKELRYGDTATLETSIDEAYQTTMARLIHLMDCKFKLFDHLKALKKYLLLGQGDFIALLMESLASNLDRPANSQYRHTLTAQLEHAIRASNAQYDSPDVLRRLDARMLELSHGEIGWDCFTLEYKIDAPVDVVITPWGSTQYLKVFNFLWRVKRVEFALGSTWRRCMTGARGVLGSVDDKVGPDWKRARCVIAEMIHFVCQLQYYILFEVIEASWDQLQIAISRPGCTLDDLIEAHAKYLNSITHKGLLGSSSRGLSSAGSSGSIHSNSGKDESFLSQLHQILKIMLAYKDAVDGLYSFSVAEFTRRQEFTARIETRTAQGGWGVTEKDLQQQQKFHNQTRHSRTGSILKANAASRSSAAPSPSFEKKPVPSTVTNASLDTPPDGYSGDGNSTSFIVSGSEDYLLPSLRARLRELSVDFRARVNTLLGDLAYQPDVDMRFLGVVMNFNDVYQVVRRRRGGGGGGAGGSSVGKEKRKPGGLVVDEAERAKEKEKG